MEEMRKLQKLTKKKMLDKEIPYSHLPKKDPPLDDAAEEAEWDEWLNRGSVQIMDLNSTRVVWKSVDPSRIIGLRFV